MTGEGSFTENSQKLLMVSLKK